MTYLRKWQTLLRIAAETGTEVVNRGVVEEGAVVVGGGTRGGVLARLAAGGGARGMWGGANGGESQYKIPTIVTK